MFYKGIRMVELEKPVRGRLLFDYSTMGTHWELKCLQQFIVKDNKVPVVICGFGLEKSGKAVLSFYPPTRPNLIRHAIVDYMEVEQASLSSLPTELKEQFSSRNRFFRNP